MDDLYRILGVKVNASADEIRERFRFLAQAFHPDKFSSPEQKQQAEEEFKIINSAYQILSVPQKRKRYDSEWNIHPVPPGSPPVDQKRQAEQTARWKKEEAARQRARSETTRRDEQRRRSREWIEANQTNQKGARLRGVDLRNARLADADFEGADLRDTNLNGARLFYARLVSADLTNSKLVLAWLTSPAYGETHGADSTKSVFRGADLRFARLGHVNFTTADMENADLTGALLYDANLIGANLRGANLTKATLRGADFSNAILMGANLNGADMEGANLANAELTNATLEGAIYSEGAVNPAKTIWPKGFDPREVGAILNDLNYQWELQRKAKEEHARQEEQEKRRSGETQGSRASCFPAACVGRLNSWPEFTPSSVGDKTTWVFATGCSTIELIGSKNSFAELVLRIDYVNENVLNWVWFEGDIMRDVFGKQAAGAANDWLNAQLALAKSTSSDLGAEKIFGDYLFTFRSKYREGMREYSFTPANRQNGTRPSDTGDTTKRRR